MSEAALSYQPALRHPALIINWFMWAKIQKTQKYNQQDHRNNHKMMKHRLGLENNESTTARAADNLHLKTHPCLWVRLLTLPRTCRCWTVEGRVSSSEAGQHVQHDLKQGLCSFPFTTGTKVPVALHDPELLSGLWHVSICLLAGLLPSSKIDQTKNRP